MVTINPTKEEKYLDMTSTQAITSAISLDSGWLDRFAGRKAGIKTVIINNTSHYSIPKDVSATAAESISTIHPFTVNNATGTITMQFRNDVPLEAARVLGHEFVEALRDAWAAQMRAETATG